MNTKKFLKQALILLGLSVGAITLFNVVPAFAQNVLTPTDNVVSDISGGATDFRSLIITIIQYFLGFLGLLAVIMIIYGGVTYVTSAGNDEAIGNAKKIIMYALIGLIVIILSFVVVNFVLGAGTGAGGA